MRAVWPSVYAFVCEGRTSSYTATAFLLKKQIRGQRADYYFMTAGHAINDCKQPRRYLTENIYQRPFESDGITLAMPLPRLEPVERVYLDDAYDVAVVKVEAAASLRIGEPLAVDDKCDRALHREIYAVGFPGVGKRRSLGLKREEKRWSKGDYVGLGRAEFRGTTSIYIASTVDLLPGNSGGPRGRRGGSAGRRPRAGCRGPRQRLPLRCRSQKARRLAVVPGAVPGRAAHHGAQRPQVSAAAVPGCFDIAPLFARPMLLEPPLDQRRES